MDQLFSSADRTGYFFVPCQEPPAPPAPLLVPCQELGGWACCFSVPPAPVLPPVHELFCEPVHPESATPAMSEARPKPARTFLRSGRSMRIHLLSYEIKRIHSHKTMVVTALSRGLCPVGAAAAVL